MPASSASKVTVKTHVLYFLVPTFTSAAQENEASLCSYAEDTIPRCKPETYVERFNYFAVKRRYKCGL
jgi:transposase-like protein